MSCKSSEGEVSKLSQLSKYKSMAWPISHPHGAPTVIWTFLHLALFKTHHKSAARQCALTVRAPDCLQNPVDAKRVRRMTTTFPLRMRHFMKYLHCNQCCYTPYTHPLQINSLCFISDSRQNIILKLSRLCARKQCADQSTGARSGVPLKFLFQWLLTLPVSLWLAQIWCCLVV